MDGLALLTEARRAGLRVALDGERLVIRGPRRAEPIARRLMEAKPAVVGALRGTAEAVRIHSRILDAEFWIAADEATAAELHREGVLLPVLLPDEAEILAGMAKADARTVLESLEKIQHVTPGARLRGFVSADGSDA